MATQVISRTERRLRTERLLLEWHEAAPTFAPDAFRPWALAGLGSCLRFDGVTWCGWVGGAVSDRGRPIDVYRQSGDAAPDRKDGAAVRSLTADSALAEGSARQSIQLTRAAVSPPFDNADRALFARVAPHLMLAFAASRRWWLANVQLGGRPHSEAAALADRDGVLLERPARFVALLQREWSGWLGERLPPPLLELAMRPGGARGRFLGKHIAAHLVPAGASWLAIARLRQPADLLTEREAEIAGHYAAGSNFRQIADGLGLAPATVRSHLRNVFGKLQVSNKTQLAAAMR